MAIILTQLVPRPHQGTHQTRRRPAKGAIWTTPARYADLKRCQQGASGMVVSFSVKVPAPRDAEGGGACSKKRRVLDQLCQEDSHADPCPGRVAIESARPSSKGERGLPGYSGHGCPPVQVGISSFNTARPRLRQDPAKARHLLFPRRRGAATPGPAIHALSPRFPPFPRGLRAQSSRFRPFPAA